MNEPKPDIKDRVIAELRVQRDNATNELAQRCAQYTELHDAFTESQKENQRLQSELAALPAIDPPSEEVKPAPATELLDIDKL